MDERNGIGAYQVWLLGCLLSCLVLAPSLVRAEQLPIKTYTTADGLANDSINQIVRDSRGFLMFCLWLGLVLACKSSTQRTSEATNAITISAEDLVRDSLQSRSIVAG